MSQNYEIEKREFIRTSIFFSVKYKFIDGIKTDQYPTLYDGETKNVSGGGLLLHGKIPHQSWIPDLLMSRILVGVKILVSEDSEPIKALARVSWVEKQEDGSSMIGLRFKEIPHQSKDRLIQLVLDYHLP